MRQQAAEISMWCCLVIRTVCGLRVLWSRVDREVSGLRGGKEQETSDNYIKRNFIICTSEQILLG